MMQHIAEEPEITLGCLGFTLCHSPALSSLGNISPFVLKALMPLDVITLSITRSNFKEFMEFIT